MNNPKTTTTTTTIITTTTKNNNNRRSTSDTEEEYHTADPSPIQQQPSPPKAKASDGGEGRRMKGMVENLGLGFRVVEMIVCLIAFSVMASDKTQGWSGDSFDRYREYRYLVAVNATGFAYAAFQAIDMTYHFIYGKHIISHYLRPHFDFLTDQILAYLLISASSSSATRVDDWVSNWGKDDFTQMATASIGMSFLAFLVFALSSIISGYNLCNQNSL